MTVAIVAALFFGGNLALSRQMLKGHGYVRNMLSESRLNRRLHAIEVSVWLAIFHAISRLFTEANDSHEYLVDSMPVEVCMNVRSYRCKLLTGKEFIGFCKAKKKFYYGFKIHMITTRLGKPIEFVITKASTADITAFRLMEIALVPGAVVYGDKAYTDYAFEEALENEESIKLIADRKRNSKRQHSMFLQSIHARMRKRIETTFSDLVRLLPRKIHAVTQAGFILKVVVFVVSFFHSNGVVIGSSYN